MENKKLKNLAGYGLVVIGNAIAAFGICFFVLKQQLIMGGVTGLAMIAQQFFHMDIAAVTYIVNIFFFFVGLFVMGKKFAFGIVISTVTFPTFLYIFESIPGLYYSGEDTMLSAIFAALFIGIGEGIILRNGASSGGLEVLSVVINHKTDIPIAVLINIVDVIILSLQLVYSSTEQILYGILLTFILTFVLNKVLMIGEKKIQVTVISPEYDKIRVALTNQDLGCTMLNICTGYGLEDQKAVMCVFNNRKIKELHNTILDIDPHAFIITSEVNNVQGRGFSLPKIRR